jgi:toxin ParE1/3/4
MTTAVLAPAALRDLVEIHDFVAHDNPAAARRLIELFERKVESLAVAPGIGRARGELLPGIRSLAVGSYVIFYRVGSQGIEVVRVLHGRRDIAAVLGSEGG